MSKKKIFTIQIVLFTLLFAKTCLASLQEDLINKLKETKTLTFTFKQIIAEKEESGKCYIKYPLLMKCNYKNLKEKSIISNGKTVAIIKKKYKKIYYYPLKSTPLFTILNKKKILNLIKNNKPNKIVSNLIEFEFINKKTDKLKIYFDKNTLEFKGWKTKDAYSNDVTFIINNLVINNQIINNFFNIPNEEDL